MDDHEIQSTVESILGPGVKVVDCEKKSCVREEEVLLINGVPIPLEGPDGVAIREAMITGQVPPCDLLNQILVKAGILRAPVRLETSLSVKSSIVTKEEVTVARGGKVVDERSRETKENNYYASSTSEIWEPVGIVHRPKNIKPFDSSDESRPNSNASSDQGYTTNTSSNHVLRERGGAATAGCPICEDNDPDCARRCLGGLAGLGAASKVPGVQTTTSARGDLNGLSFSLFLRSTEVSQWVGRWLARKQSGQAGYPDEPAGDQVEFSARKLRGLHGEPDGKWESENRSINPIKFCNAPGCRSNGSNSNIGLTPTKLHFTKLQNIVDNVATGLRGQILRIDVALVSRTVVNDRIPIISFSKGKGTASGEE
ncbi:hypothetical protein V1478_012144 [Vespula squamosa]|uniref:Uncharacterized protein n=1 Tax=Vespula squamosa TaxID=30214 RepID=A0ABD2ACD9_VESSQ